MKQKKQRADRLLVEAGLCDSEAAAAALLMSGKVLANVSGKERKIEKAGEMLPRDASFRLKGKPRPFVSRAGLKLAAALDAFNIDPKGRVCADIGISTGGFTDCLLSRGAARVFGVDVGYGDVAWPIRSDPRVQLFERTNARHLTEEHFKERVSLLVADVSFISLTTILPALLGQVAPGADLLLLVKPQFEADRADVGDGVVTDPAVREAVMKRISEAAETAGLTVRGRIESPITGADGNVELLLHLEAP